MERLSSTNGRDASERVKDVAQQHNTDLIEDGFSLLKQSVKGLSQEDRDSIVKAGKELGIKIHTGWEDSLGFVDGDEDKYSLKKFFTICAFNTTGSAELSEYVADFYLWNIQTEGGYFYNDENAAKDKIVKCNYSEMVLGAVNYVDEAIRG